MKRSWVLLLALAAGILLALALFVDGEMMVGDIRVQMIVIGAIILALTAIVVIATTVVVRKVLDRLEG